MVFGAGSGNRTRTLSLEGSYDTISPYPHVELGVDQAIFNVKDQELKLLQNLVIWGYSAQDIFIQWRSVS